MTGNGSPPGRRAAISSFIWPDPKDASEMKRRVLRHSWTWERLDARTLLSVNAVASPLLVHPLAYQVVQPNLPILPYATPSKKATFIDPTVSVLNGQSVVLGYQDFIGPYATLDGRAGAIKIANGSDVLDNATIKAGPGRLHGNSVVSIGTGVVIGFGAKVVGPSSIGSFDSGSKPVSIGARAEIDNATIAPGAIVSPLARVGPGVTVPSGFRVLPGMNVTTDAEASNPKLGMVVAVTASDLSTLTKTLSENESLATGYAALYQNNSATGVSPGASPTVSGIDNGDLATILGANQQPGPTSASFEPARSAPQFVSPRQGLVASVLSNFPARITGGVIVNMRAHDLAGKLGRANAIRADQGQPITIGSIARTGSRVTINSPLGGTLTIGRDFRAGNNAVILSGPGVNATIGDDVKIDAGAVVNQTSLARTRLLARAHISISSTFPARTVIPANAIYISNKFMGYVQR